MSDEKTPDQELIRLVEAGAHLQQFLYLKKTLGSLTVFLISTATVTVIADMKAGLTFGLCGWAISWALLAFGGRKAISAYEMHVREYAHARGLEDPFGPQFGTLDRLLFRAGYIFFRLDNLPDWFAIAVIVLLIGTLIVVAIRGVAGW